MEGILNMSRCHSYSNMPISTWSDWLDGSSGMRKKTNGFPNCVQETSWSNLHSHKTRLALKELLKERKGKEGEN